MKKISILALAALSMAACQNNGYTISGIADETLEGKTAYLIDNNTNEAIDSCVITNNAFTFAKDAVEPAIMRAQVARKHCIVFVEPGSVINVDLTPSSNPDKQPVTDNGGANDKKTAFFAELNDFMGERRKIYEELLQSGAPQEEVMKYSNQAQVELEDFYKKNIAANKDNIYGAYMLANVAGNIYSTTAELDSAIAAVKYAKNIKSLESLRTSLGYKEATSVGKPYVDFKGKGKDGNEVALSDYVGKGKYVLVDFWASWCGPCRGEIPNLLEVNKLYGGDKFEVLGVNVWDQEQKFKESIQNEGMNYSQIFVPSDVNATELYGIQGIPQIMLIGPDGTILKRNLRGADIKKAVEEALSK